MRPYLLGITVILGWTLIAAGVVANLAGVQGVGNRPFIAAPSARTPPEDTMTLDASVPLAGGPVAPEPVKAL